MPDILELSALELGREIRCGEIGVREAVSAVLDAMEKNAQNAYITVLRDRALSRAEAVQREIKGGGLSGPLAGVPAGIKDNLCTGGVKTTCASRMLSEFYPPYSATAVERLEEGGCVCVGKTNMDEFAMGSTGETSFFGMTQNPWNPAHVPGGSSSGSGAAVAAGQAYFALGSDTGGSVRTPAAFCGVTGMKPTYGTVSRYGLIAYASSLDQIGVLAKTAADCAAVFDLIGGRDKRDGTSLDTEAGTFLSGLTGDVRGVRIGIAEECFGAGLDESVRRHVLAAGETLKGLGAALVPLSMPLLRYAVPAYYLIACAEAGSNLSRFDGVKYGFRAENACDIRSLYEESRSRGFGLEVKKRILLGTFALSAGFYDAYYKKAQQVRGAISRAYAAAFSSCDLILAPVFPTTAPKLGEATIDPMQKYLGDIYTVSVNLAGLPGISIPCGFDEAGLPIGAQLIGPPLSDERVLNAAHAYQQATVYHTMRPGKERSAP